MNFREGGVGGPTPLEPALSDPADHALDQCRVALDHLVKLVEDGVLDTLDDPGLVGVMQQFETWRNRLPLVDHHVIAEPRREIRRRRCVRAVWSGCSSRV